MLPFNKRPGRDPRDDAPEGDPTDRALQRSSRAVPPPARSQPRVERFEEEPVQPIRPFQASRSDEEVTTFMASPAKKPAAPLAHSFEETGETATALHYVRPPAPSEPDEEEDSHTQIRHMPRRGRVAPAVQAQPRGKEPPVVRLDPRAEVSLSLSAAVLEEDHETGANAPDFTVQLGPGPGQNAAAAPAPAQPVAPQPAPAPIVHAQPQPFPAQAAMAPPAHAVPHTFSPVTSAPLVSSRSQPPMGLAPGAQLPPAMRSGPVPAMGMPSAMQSGPVASLPPASHAPFASPAHFSVPPARPLDPPAMALSTSLAAPKPARVWAMALVAVGAAAALAAFVLRGSPTVAAFVDPSRAPGGRAAPAEVTTPGAQQTQPVQAVQAVQPSQPLNASPPAVAAPAVTAQIVGAQPVQPVNPPVAVPAQPAVAVGVAPPAPAPPIAAAAAPEPKPVAVAPKPAPAPKPEKPIAAAPKPVAAKPEPKPVAVAAAPKPAPAKPEPKGAKKPATAAEKEMKDAADALARAQLEQSL